MLIEVEYWIGTYHGRIPLNGSEGDSEEYLIARAKQVIRTRCGGFPLGLYYEKYKVHRAVGTEG